MTNALESRDGKTKLKLIGDTGSSLAEVQQSDSAKKGKHKAAKGPSPVLIVGFPGTGLIGSICANYIIEKKNLHQLAFVDSEYLIPSAIFVGGKLRHPFRIYSDAQRSILVTVCEAPVRSEGIHSILALLVQWALDIAVKEIIILDGAPSKGIPGGSRNALILSGNSSGSSKSNTANVRSAIITGISGGLISSCLSSDLPCTAVLITSTPGIPDPEGAAIVLDSVSHLPHVPLKIDTDPLRKQGMAIKAQLKQFMNAVAKDQEDKTERGRYLRSSRIYG